MRRRVEMLVEEISKMNVRDTSDLLIGLSKHPESEWYRQLFILVDSYKDAIDEVLKADDKPVM